MPDAHVPLRAQLACARRELALRERVYPRLVARETLRADTAQHELAAMRAICETLAGLVAAEAGEAGGGQAEMFGSAPAREAEPCKHSVPIVMRNITG